MPRSATDATRFTATGPYAQSYSNATTAGASPFQSSSKSTGLGTTVPFPSSPPPPNETPQQKVARLREAARLAKASQESTFDRWLYRGRAVADKAHRVTVLGLITLSAVCTGMAAYSLGDMVLYNRRKRREFFLEQQQNYDMALQKAIKAEKEGTLTADLALVLNKERAVLAYEAEQARKGGFVKQAKEWLFGGLAQQEMAGGRLGKGGFDAEEIKRIAEGRFQEAGSNKLREPNMREIEPEVMVKEAAAVRSLEERRGGILDRMAEDVASDVNKSARTWWSWVRGRSA